MKNKLLLVILAALIAGCVDKVEYETALKDPITLNLVKQSIGDYVSQPYSLYGTADFVDNYYNSCSLLSRLKISIWLTGTYRQISCEALDLRLNNKGIAVSASSLVGYYMNEQAEEQEKAENQRIKAEVDTQQQKIKDMANGK